jgi:hypothetical protein
MSKTIEVPIKGARGEDLGFAIKLGPAGEPIEDDPTGVKTLAARVEGWTTLKVDGEAYTYSQARALGLLQRFPSFARQLEEAALAKDDKKEPAK